jgi:hypothetical protein
MSTATVPRRRGRAAVSPTVRPRACASHQPTRAVAGPARPGQVDQTSHNRGTTTASWSTTEKTLRGQCVRSVPAAARLFAIPLFATHHAAEQAWLASNLARSLETAAQGAFARRDDVAGSRYHAGAQFAALFAAALRGENDACVVCARAVPAQARGCVRALFAADNVRTRAGVASDLVRCLVAAGEDAVRCGRRAEARFLRVGAQFAALFADALRASVPTRQGRVA